MDFNTHSGLFRNEGKFKKKKNCYFKIEVGINSESFQNGAIFEIINEILKWFFLHYIEAIVSKFENVGFSKLKLLH